MFWGSELRSGLELDTVWDSRWMADHPFISVRLTSREERVDPVCVCVCVEDVLCDPCSALDVRGWSTACSWCQRDRLQFCHNFWNMPRQTRTPASPETPERVWTCGDTERRIVKMEGNLVARDRTQGCVFELCSQWRTVPVLCSWCSRLVGVQYCTAVYFNMSVWTIK